MAADDPFDAAIGLGLVGFGVLLAWATVKKVPGGAIGALKTVLRTGKLVHPDGTTFSPRTGEGMPETPHTSTVTTVVDPDGTLTTEAVR